MVSTIPEVYKGLEIVGEMFLKFERLLPRIYIDRTATRVTIEAFAIDDVFL